MYIDNKLLGFYNNKVKQVFVYITSRCQLRCRQCLYKPLLCEESTDIDFDALKDLLSMFRSLGAYKASFLGGEPTLYSSKGNRFTDILCACKDLGYDYVRFDTNGQFSADLLNDEGLRKADEITFSLDGFNKDTNDIIRGNGSFDKCVANIIAAVHRNYKVQITMCVHRAICQDAKSGIENIEKMVQFAASLGVSVINFHPIIKAGISRDNWIEDTDISPIIWKQIYEHIQLHRKEYSIQVRLPMRFVEKKEYELKKERFTFCPVRLAERALIMPDGTVKVCAFTIGTQYHIAEYDGSRIELYEGEFSEFTLCDSVKDSGECLFQKSMRDDLIPLCMSFKPCQNEIVWKDIMPEE